MDFLFCYKSEGGKKSQSAPIQHTELYLKYKGKIYSEKKISVTKHNTQSNH